MSYSDITYVNPNIHRDKLYETRKIFREVCPDGGVYFSKAMEQWSKDPYLTPNQAAIYNIVIVPYHEDKCYNDIVYTIKLLEYTGIVMLNHRIRFQFVRQLKLIQHGVLIFRHPVCTILCETSYKDVYHLLYATDRVWKLEYDYNSCFVISHRMMAENITSFSASRPGFYNMGNVMSVTSINGTESFFLGKDGGAWWLIGHDYLLKYLPADILKFISRFLEGDYLINSITSPYRCTLTLDEHYDLKTYISNNPIFKHREPPRDPGTDSMITQALINCNIKQGVFSDKPRIEADLIF